MTDAQRSTVTDYDELIGRLDLPTKVRLLTGAATFTLAPEESIGLGELRLSDGPTGVRGLKFSGGRTVALFPNATLLAAAWSEETAYEVGPAAGRGGDGASRSTSCSARRSTCTAPCSAAGCSRPTPRTRC